ncbi:MAG: GTPase ObgE, partial [Burkholderiales bacterium]|nr:GTPase ObgE [Burkholderiales bacterium]
FIATQRNQEQRDQSTLVEEVRAIVSVDLDDPRFKVID